MKARYVACPLVIPSSFCLFCTLITRLQSLQRGHVEERVSLHFAFSFLSLSLPVSCFPPLSFSLPVSLFPAASFSRSFFLPLVSLAPSVVLQDSRRHKPPVENMFPKSNVNIDTSSVQIDKCVLRFWNSRNTTGTSTMGSVTWIERQ